MRGTGTRTLIVSSRFPSPTHPDIAPYNRDQFSTLGRRAVVEVISGVPWSLLRRNDDVGSSNRSERIEDVVVRHPRLLTSKSIPALKAGLMVTSLAPSVWLRARARRSEVILAASAYPDGVAGVILGQVLGLPVVIKCRGADLVEAEKDTFGLVQLSFALRRAERVVVTCKALVHKIQSYGVAEARIHVVHEGVDRNRFRPRDMATARRKSGLPEHGTLVLFVGDLTRESGLRAFLAAARLVRQTEPQATFIVVGDGPLDEELREASESGLFIPSGVIDQEELAEYLAASDVVCLPGVHSGLPNVLRETLASGRPAVVRRSGGVAEIMTHACFGTMINRSDSKTIAQAILETVRLKDEPAFRAAHAFLPSWEDSSDRLSLVLQEAVAAVRG